eukprot:TRINITY_DN2576_c1_g1_i5.p1 TRINITY_DN2576_c1_g1~~TRINITY_DN2576_c1_g1_i5.p1  ORF type:complete len:486 (-),score=32.92 TRINITY_DN2576_c1_g1_i5:158-1549(-)
MTIKIIVLLLTFVASSFCSSRLTEKSIQGLLSSNGGVPLLDPPQRTAGYFKLNRTFDAQMFYFFFESRNDPQNDPLVLWLTGGPGCASELAIFYENGPFYIQENLTLVESEYGWDRSHNMIYVDQPIFTGFSYSDYPRDTEYNEKQVAQDLYEFLEEFLQKHPKFIQNEFFVTGESYGGHYVPAISSKIFNANLNSEGPIKMNFKGFAIGDGYTNPGVQIGQYAQYAYINNLITVEQRDKVNANYPQCKNAVQECNNNGSHSQCVFARELCYIFIFGELLRMIGNINYYDIRKECTHPPLCYDFSRLVHYLDQPTVREELGVDRRFQECSGRVGQDFAGDIVKNMAGVIPQMLDAGIRVNLYEGDKDFICNWLGNRAWVDQLNWTMSDQWEHVQDVKWKLPNGKSAGTVAKVGPLQFTKIFDAGHLVPMDQPESAYHQIYYFTRNKPLVPPPVERETMLVLEQ